MCTTMLKTKAARLRSSLALVEQADPPLTKPSPSPARSSPPENMRLQVMMEEPHFLDSDQMMGGREDRDGLRLESGLEGLHEAREEEARHQDQHPLGQNQ